MQNLDFLGFLCIIECKKNLEYFRENNAVRKGVCTIFRKFDHFLLICVQSTMLFSRNIFEIENAYRT